MNKRGVYTPEQISENVKHYWSKHVGEAATANKEDCKKIVSDTVNYLGSIGDGAKFDESTFNDNYQKVDMLGFEKNQESSVIIIVTSMACKPQ